MKNTQSGGVTYHIPHGISLETKLLGEVEEDIFNFLFGERNLALCRPSGISFPCAGPVVNDGRGGRFRVAYTASRWTERFCRRCITLTVNIAIRVSVLRCYCCIETEKKNKASQTKLAHGKDRRCRSDRNSVGHRKRDCCRLKRMCLCGHQGQRCCQTRYRSTVGHSLRQRGRGGVFLPRAGTTSSLPGLLGQVGEASMGCWLEEKGGGWCENDGTCPNHT